MSNFIPYSHIRLTFSSLEGIYKSRTSRTNQKLVREYSKITFSKNESSSLKQNGTILSSLTHSRTKSYITFKEGG